jgi:energy-coupling factor transport system ATP-binding protein
VKKSKDRPAIFTEKAAFRYPRGTQGLKPTSFEISMGDIALISGASGSGKSTLARCLTGLIPHLYHGDLTGHVRICGLDTRSTPLWRISEQAGLVSQNPPAQMITSSVEKEIIFGLENLGLSEDEVQSRVENSLEKFDLSELRRRSPRTLSGGEQQKLALAASFARRPKILVLDEPLSMLDIGSARDLLALAVQLTQDHTTVVFCEHREEYFAHIPNLQRISLNGTTSSTGKFAPPLYPGQQVSDAGVEIEGLHVNLSGKPILRDLNFSLNGGEVTALVGQNGAGKTTLLRVLVGLQKHQGILRHYGNTKSLPLGIVFQNPDSQLFNPTVREEILFRLPNPDMMLYAWLIEYLGLERYERTSPLLLSEGEKKRLSLATVLMRDPELGILLDEPALGQDQAHKTRLIGLLRAVAASGRIVLMTTHDLPLAAQADRLILLGPDGKLTDTDSEDLYRYAEGSGEFRGHPPIKSLQDMTHPGKSEINGINKRQKMRS